MAEEGNRFHIRKTIDLSFVFAIIIQTGVAVWWASSIDSRLVALEVNFEENRQELAQENLRQWSRINRVEEATRNTQADLNTTIAILERVDNNVEQLEDQISETNDLLREYLTDRVDR